VPRPDFVPKEYAHFAYEDSALPIGAGQTISQPYTVVFMLELLAPQPGDHIMEVGAGSGWQTALLAALVGEAGHVYAIEINPLLAEFAEEHLAKYPELTGRITWYTQNAAAGLPEVAKQTHGFDGVIAAAEVGEVPTAWREQLKPGGRLVYPKAGSIFLEVKDSRGTFSVKEYPGFAFVPFIS
jgi:protein-L-isoaspartate(D-aspartate) O-methyltransferase